jgi:hypothetical protein
MGEMHPGTILYLTTYLVLSIHNHLLGRAREILRAFKVFKAIRLHSTTLMRSFTLQRYDYERDTENLNSKLCIGKDLVNGEQKVKASG